MGDWFEFMVAIDLRDELSDAEVAELRWHLGLGPQPRSLTILTDFDEVLIGDDGQPEVGEDGEWKVASCPRPVLARHGAASRIGGVLFGAIARRPAGGWALTARQELHPDEFAHVDELLDWLAARGAYDFVGVDGEHRTGGCGQYLGYLRFHEEFEIRERLTIEDGKIVRRSG